MQLTRLTRLDFTAPPPHRRLTHPRRSRAPRLVEVTPNLARHHPQCGRRQRDIGGNHPSGGGQTRTVQGARNASGEGPLLLEAAPMLVKPPQLGRNRTICFRSRHDTCRNRPGCPSRPRAPHRWVEAVPNLAAAVTSVETGRHRQIWPNPGRLRPTWGRVQPKWTKSGQARPDFDEISTDFGQCRPDFGEQWAAFDEIWTDFGQSRLP